MTWDEAEELWMANQCGMLRDHDRSRLAEATLILSNEKNRPPGPEADELYEFQRRSPPDTETSW